MVEDMAAKEGGKEEEKMSVGDERRWLLKVTFPFSWGLERHERMQKCSQAFLRR